MITRFSGIILILFLPSYPLFFTVFKEKDFNALEKLGLTIVLNLSFYVILGYIGFSLGFPLSGSFFLIVTIIVYLAIITYIIYIDIRTNKFHFIKLEKFSLDNERLQKFSIFAYLKKNLSGNALFIIIFLFLLIILDLLRFTYFFGTDPWIHITIIKMITTMNVLPIGEYYGTLGLHIFSAVIHFFVGIDVILIPKYFILYTIPISALIFYNILMRIFKNKDLAILGVFLLEFSSLGFSYMMLQFWPSSLILIQFLTIFFLLYKRLENFLQLESPTKELIFKDIFFNYSIIFLIFISAVLIHTLTSIILLLTLIWVFLIYFLKDCRRGIDFLILCVLLGCFLFIFFILGIGTEHVWFIKGVSFSTTTLLIAAGGVGVFGGLLIWRVRKSILYTKGRFKLTITGEKNRIYKYIEDKYFIPAVFLLVLVYSIIFLITNTLIFNLIITNLFMGIEMLVLVMVAMWGLIIFQKKPKGKFFLIWGIGFLFVFVGVFVFDVITTNNKMWARIFYMMPPMIVIGFLAYVYKLIKNDSIKLLKSKLFILFIITFSLFATYYHETFTAGDFSLTHREVSVAKHMSEYTDDDYVMITEFGFEGMYLYYDYPYEDKDEDLGTEDVDYFVKYTENLFPPENHLNKSGGNKLQELKREHDADVYIALDDFYFLNDEWQVYGELTEEETEEYYELDYLNRIYSAKDETGKESPLYWVI